MDRFWFNCICFGMCVGIVAAQPANPPSTKGPARSAAEWIGPGDESIPILMRYLQAKEPIVVRAALHDFATRGPRAKPAIPIIRTLLKHSDATVCIEAAWTLIDLQEETGAALKAITDTAKAKDSSTRAYAARALGEIVNPPFLICCWGPGPRPMTPRPALRQQVEPVLMNLLNDREVRVRLAAAEALVRIGKEAKVVVPVLVGALQETDQQIRLEAENLLRRVDREAFEKASRK